MTLAPCDIRIYYLKLSFAAKNSTHQNRAKVQSDSTQKFCTTMAKNVVGTINSLIVPGCSSYLLPITSISKMYQTTRNLFSVTGVVYSVAVRGIRTSAVVNATKSFPAEPGLVSEDKILHIKQHQNDYTQQYPSVTLILNKTMTEDSRKALEKWKKERIEEMGLEEFNNFHEGECSKIKFFQV